jgi:alpha-glucoside transport system substrate-binding protein
VGTRTKAKISALSAVAILGIVVTGCSSSSSPAPAASSTTAGALPDLSGQHLTVLAEWSGAEQTDFQKVLDGFTAATHATVSYQGAGDNTVTVLQSKIAGGSPPDVALLASPGAITTLANQGSLKPLDAGVQAELAAHYDPGWATLGTINGKLYSVVFKAADKSTFWYNTAAFDQAGVTPPTDWTSFLKDCQTLSDAGVTPVSIGGADGWTLADWFQNIYLSQAGTADYDKLSHHQIKWTDPTVVKALTTLGQLFGTQKYVAGGDAGALQTTFNNSVTQTFTANPKAAMVYEGDFASTVISSTTSTKVGTGAKFFPFPASGSTTNFVQGAGDLAVALNSNAATMALIKYLASPQAAAIWAGLGGFLSPNKDVPVSDYPDAVTQAEARQLLAAGPNFRFSLDDLSPAAFGGTVGAGYWKDMQDFLKNPSNVAGTAQQLETDADKVTWK